MLELLDTAAAPKRTSARVLMLVDANVAADKERATRNEGPRRDYVLLAEALNADIYDIGAMKAGFPGALLSKLAGKGPAHAILASSLFKHYDLVFSDNEYSGLFSALLLRRMSPRPRHVVLAHHLTPRKKRLIARLGRGGIDRLILHAETQRSFAIEHLGFDPLRIEVLPYQVDTCFWQPARPWSWASARHSRRQLEETPATHAGLVAAAGLECRDYPTLIQAMDGLGLELRIAAASNWSRKKNTLHDVTLPSNIAVNSYGYLGLRQLYDSALFVVVPLQDVDFQAGITTVLEGMAMGRAVISTLTTGRQRAFEGPLWRAGLSDWPSDGPCLDLASGIYVPPADPVALHAAMRFLRDHPVQADVIGANARRRVEDGFAVEQFAARMAQAILRA